MPRLQARQIRYLAVGSGIFAANVALAALVFRIPYCVSTTFTRNASNVLVTEVALVLAFFAHRSLTWNWKGDGLLRALVLFHVVSAVGLLLRAGVFFGLDQVGFDPVLATVVSVAVVIVVNFLGYDRVVFRAASQQ